jgi:hypothetical protein
MALWRLRPGNIGAFDERFRRRQPNLVCLSGQSDRKKEKVECAFVINEKTMQRLGAKLHWIDG